MDRLTAEDLLMLWPDEIWPQEIGALAILDGRNLLRNQVVSKGRGRALKALAMTEHQPGRQERQWFGRELGAIEAKVIELFTTVADDLPRATDALLNGNSEAARALAERASGADP